CPLLFTHMCLPALYPLSLHDALPIFPLLEVENGVDWRFTTDHPGDSIEPYLRAQGRFRHLDTAAVARIQEDVDARWAHLCRQVGDRKSTRLNSSHVKISYAVFCLKKK